MPTSAPSAQDGSSPIPHNLGANGGGDSHQQQHEQTPVPSRRRDPQMRLPKFTQLNKAAKRDGDAADDEGAGLDDGDEDGDDDDGWQPATAPVTPNIAETAQQLRRSLSVASLHDLAHMPPSEIRRSVGNKVWRPQDEEARIPGDWERLAVHVARGALRAGNLAFGLRATLQLVLVLIKGIRTRKLPFSALVQAIFGPDNFRFSAMFAIWAALYKAVHNSLRLITPLPPGASHRVRRSRSAPNVMHIDSSAPGTVSGTSSGYVSEEGNGSGPGRGALTPGTIATEKAQKKKRAFMHDPRSKVWHAYLAGAISALGVLVERKENRISLAQQLFVRGMEGTYNVAHGKGMIAIPHGAVITFGLACGQIMYAWLNVPDSLPRSYTSWITTASQVSPAVLPLHRDILFNAHADPNVALKYFPDGKFPEPICTSPLRYANVPPNRINRRGISGKVVAQIAEWVEKAKKGEPGEVVPCSLVHPWESSHLWSPIDRFVEVTRWILPVYMTLHFVPAMFLRTRGFLKDPLRVFLRSLFGSVRSSSFLGVFVIIFQTWFCALHDFHGYIRRNPELEARLPRWFINALIHSGTYWVGGFLTCLSLFVENSRRRAELAMYVLPKGMESAWSIARQRSWVPFVPGGDLLLTSMGMSLVMGTYAQNPEHLSGLVRRIVYQFVGRN